MLKASKRNTILYWFFTLWLVLGMVSTAIGQLIQMKEGQGGLDMVTHLGYPAYLLTVLGFWKILGSIAVLMPKTPLLKEWAYAGFFFVCTGAIYSHIATGDSIGYAIPATGLLVLTTLSWYFRPVSRRLVSTH